MSNSIKFTGNGHIRFKKFLKNFTKEMERNVNIATKQNLLFVKKEITNGILKRKYERNAEITEMLKGQNFPLVDTSEMIQSLETKQKNAFGGEVGYLRNKKTSHGGDFFKVLTVIHDGAVIKITPKMRRFIFAKLSEKGLISTLPPKKSTGFIRIKGRPFLEEPLKDKKLNDSIIKRWEDAALKKTMKKF